MAPRSLLRLATYLVAGVDVVTGLKLYAFPDCANGPLKNNSVCDTTASPKSRAAALVAALTLEEKFNNTGNTAPGVPRLGIPPYQWWNEALHGVAYEYGGDLFADANVTDQFTYATSFPQPILMGAAFDDDLIKAVAEVVSTEARAFSNAGRYGIDAWTPNVNPFKDPRWGRGQETPGEDPFHIASYVRALLHGLQGGLHPKYKKVIATCKHFVGYDMESWNGNWRYQFDAQISPQDMSEYYTPPFASCARDANVGSFMCSYNAANGVPTCADPYLIETLLREHWGWTGDDQYVVSDCDAIENVYLPHMWGSTQEEAAADSLNAGVDLNCGTYYQTYLPLAYEQGLINETTLDTALTRVYGALVQLGYFDPAAVQPYRALNWSDVNTAHAQEVALRAAHEGIVLLKNADGALPLSLDGIPIAFIGEWANATTQMQGNYHGTAPFLTSPLMAAQAAGLNVSYANGNGQGDPTTGAWADVWAVAADAEVIFYIGGIDNSIESEGMDRASIGWSGAQLDLITRLASQGKPTVVVAMGGGQIDSAPLAANTNISAILWAGYPGQAGGTALLDILTGKVAPAGRIPTTQYPAGYIKELPMTDMTLRPDEKSGSPGRTYMWYNGKPTYPFGWGLHYTTFAASLALSSNNNGSSMPMSSLTTACNSTLLDTCPFAYAFDMTVLNTGNTSSDYTALFFLRFPSASGPQPVPHKALMAYHRFHALPPGEPSTASVTIDLGRLARADEKGDKRIWPGTYSVEVGVDGEELAGSAVVSFELTGADDGLLVEEWPRMSGATARTARGVPGLERYFVAGY